MKVGVQGEEGNVLQTAESKSRLVSLFQRRVLLGSQDNNTHTYSLHTYSLTHSSCSTWDLVPWPGIEPETLALGVWSLNSWTTRDVTHNDLLNCSPMDFCEVKQAMRTYQENDGRGMLTTNPTPTQVGMKTKQKQEKVLPAGYSWERPQEDCSLLLPFGTNWEFHEPVSSLWPQCSVIDCKWRQLWRFPHSESWGHGKASGRIRSTPVGAHWLIIDCQGTWCCKRFWSAKHMIVFLCYHFLSDWGSI